MLSAQPGIANAQLIEALKETRGLTLELVHDLSEAQLMGPRLEIVVPNALTLLTFVLGVVLIEIQVRLEEKHLMRAHADEYAQYCARVRRWF